MATLFEVLMTCDSNNTMWTCSVWDPKTGTSLMTYKGGGTAAAKTLDFIGNDYLAAVQKDKSVLHVWPLNSHQTIQGMRFILPGKANAVAFTHDGSYFIAAIDKKIYLWQVASGELLTVLNRNYQKVVILKFTPDGQFFVSADEGGIVMVWSLATVAVRPQVELITQRTAGQYDPVYTFSDHTNSVTDVCVSKTGMSGRLVTVASDQTCKIYDLASGTLLLNLAFDEELTSVTMDVLEINIFVGTAEGKIHQFSLTNPPRYKDLQVKSAECPSFVAHTKAVTCLSASMNGDILMSGGNDEKVILWNIDSRQAVRFIQHKGAVTNAFFTVNYPAMYKQDFLPSIILHSLERTSEKDTSEKDISEKETSRKKSLEAKNNSEKNGSEKKNSRKKSLEVKGPPETDKDDFIEIEVLSNENINHWPEDLDLEVNFENPVYSASTKEIEREFTHKELIAREELDKLRNINSALYTFKVNEVLNSDNVVINVSGKKKKLAKKNKKR